MGFGITATLEQNTENKAGVVAVVEDIFNDVKKTIISNVGENSKNMEPELRDHILRKVQYFWYCYSPPNMARVLILRPFTVGLCDGTNRVTR